MLEVLIMQMVLAMDNTGQYVIYDAHNVVKNNSGTDLEYWDVGIVKYGT